eukprot:ANDGO_00404.mRNA.1 hypothetical protein GUITHDRAFT_116414
MSGDESEQVGLARSRSVRFSLPGNTPASSSMRNPSSARRGSTGPSTSNVLLVDDARDEEGGADVDEGDDSYGGDEGVEMGLDAEDANERAENAAVYTRDLNPELEFLRGAFDALFLDALRRDEDYALEKLDTAIDECAQKRAFKIVGRPPLVARLTVLGLSTSVALQSRVAHLWAMGSRDELNCNIMCEAAGLMNLAVRFLYSNDLSTVTYITEFWANVAGVPTAKSYITLESLDRIVAFLCIPDAAIRKSASLCTATLSSDPKFVQMLCDCKSVPKLIAVARYGHQLAPYGWGATRLARMRHRDGGRKFASVDAQYNALHTLANMCSDDNVRLDICKNYGMLPILAIGQYGDVEGKIFALRILKKLAESPVLHSLFISTGAIPILIRITERYSDFYDPKAPKEKSALELEQMLMHTQLESVTKPQLFIETENRPRTAESSVSATTRSSTLSIGASKNESAAAAEERHNRKNVAYEAFMCLRFLCSDAECLEDMNKAGFLEFLLKRSVKALAEASPTVFEVLANMCSRYDNVRKIALRRGLMAALIQHIKRGYEDETLNLLFDHNIRVEHHRLLRRRDLLLDTFSQIVRCLSSLMESSNGPETLLKCLRPKNEKQGLRKSFALKRKQKRLTSIEDSPPSSPGSPAGSPGILGLDGSQFEFFFNPVFSFLDLGFGQSDSFLGKQELLETLRGQTMLVIAHLTDIESVQDILIDKYSLVDRVVQYCLVQQSEVQYACCRSLSNLALVREDVRLRVAQLQGLAPVVGALRSPDQLTQIEAARCLVNFSISDDCRKTITDLSAFASMLRVAAGPSASEEFRYQVILALRNYSVLPENQRAVVEQQCVPFLLTRLKQDTHRDAILIQIVSTFMNLASSATPNLKVVDNLCKNDSSALEMVMKDPHEGWVMVRDILVKEGIFEAIADSLSCVHLSSADIQFLSMCADVVAQILAEPRMDLYAANLSRDSVSWVSNRAAKLSQEHRLRLSGTPLLEILVSMLRHSHRGVQVSVASALANASSEEECRDQILRIAGASLLVNEGIESGHRRLKIHCLRMVQNMAIQPENRGELVRCGVIQSCSSILYDCLYFLDTLPERFEKRVADLERTKSAAGDNASVNFRDWLTDEKTEEELIWTLSTLRNISLSPEFHYDIVKAGCLSPLFKILKRVRSRSLILLGLSVLSNVSQTEGSHKILLENLPCLSLVEYCLCPFESSVVSSASTLATAEKQKRKKKTKKKKEEKSKKIVVEEEEFAIARDVLAAIARSERDNSLEWIPSTLSQVSLKQLYVHNTLASERSFLQRESIRVLANLVRFPNARKKILRSSLCISAIATMVSAGSDVSRYPRFHRSDVSPLVFETPPADRMANLLNLQVRSMLVVAEAVNFLGSLASQISSSPPASATVEDSTPDGEMSDDTLFFDILLRTPSSFPHSPPSPYPLPLHVSSSDTNQLEVPEQQQHSEFADSPRNSAVTASSEPGSPAVIQELDSDSQLGFSPRSTTSPSSATPRSALFPEDSGGDDLFLTATSIFNAVVSTLCDDELLVVRAGCQAVYRLAVDAFSCDALAMCGCWDLIMDLLRAEDVILSKSASSALQEMQETVMSIEREKVRNTESVGRSGVEMEEDESEMENMPVSFIWALCHSADPRLESRAASVFEIWSSKLTLGKSLASVFGSESGEEAAVSISEASKTAFPSSPNLHSPSALSPASQSPPGWSPRSVSSSPSNAANHSPDGSPLHSGSVEMRPTADGPSPGATEISATPPQAQSKTKSEPSSFPFVLPDNDAFYDKFVRSGALRSCFELAMEGQSLEDRLKCLRCVLKVISAEETFWKEFALLYKKMQEDKTAEKKKRQTKRSQKLQKERREYRHLLDTLKRRAAKERYLTVHGISKLLNAFVQHCAHAWQVGTDDEIELQSMVLVKLLHILPDRLLPTWDTERVEVRPIETVRTVAFDQDLALEHLSYLIPDAESATVYSRNESKCLAMMLSLIKEKTATTAAIACSQFLVFLCERCLKKADDFAKSLMNYVAELLPPVFEKVLSSHTRQHTSRAPEVVVDAEMKPSGISLSVPGFHDTKHHFSMQVAKNISSVTSALFRYCSNCWVESERSFSLSDWENLRVAWASLKWGLVHQVLSFVHSVDHSEIRRRLRDVLCLAAALGKSASAMTWSQSHFWNWSLAKELLSTNVAEKLKHTLVLEYDIPEKAVNWNDPSGNCAAFVRGVRYLSDSQEVWQHVLLCAGEMSSVSGEVALAFCSEWGSSLSHSKHKDPSWSLISVMLQSFSVYAFQFFSLACQMGPLLHRFLVSSRVCDTIVGNILKRRQLDEIQLWRRSFDFCRELHVALPEQMREEELAEGTLISLRQQALRFTFTLISEGVMLDRTLDDKMAVSIAQSGVLHLAAASANCGLWLSAQERSNLSVDSLVDVRVFSYAILQHIIHPHPRCIQKRIEQRTLQGRDVLYGMFERQNNESADTHTRLAEAHQAFANRILIEASGDLSLFASLLHTAFGCHPRTFDPTFEGVKRLPEWEREMAANAAPTDMDPNEIPLGEIADHFDEASLVFSEADILNGSPLFLTRQGGRGSSKKRFIFHSENVAFLFLSLADDLVSHPVVTAALTAAMLANPTKVLAPLDSPQFATAVSGLLHYGSLRCRGLVLRSLQCLARFDAFQRWSVSFKLVDIMLREVNYPRHVPGKDRKKAPDSSEHAAVVVRTVSPISQLEILSAPYLQALVCDDIEAAIGLSLMLSQNEIVLFDMFREDRVVRLIKQFALNSQASGRIAELHSVSENELLIREKNYTYNFQLMLRFLLRISELHSRCGYVVSHVTDIVFQLAGMIFTFVSENMDARSAMTSSRSKLSLDSSRSDRSSRVHDRVKNIKSSRDRQQPEPRIPDAAVENLSDEEKCVVTALKILCNLSTADDSKGVLLSQLEEIYEKDAFRLFRCVVQLMGSRRRSLAREAFKFASTWILTSSVQRTSSTNANAQIKVKRWFSFEALSETLEHIEDYIAQHSPGEEEVIGLQNMREVLDAYATAVGARQLPQTVLAEDS